MLSGGGGRPSVRARAQGLSGLAAKISRAIPVELSMVEGDLFATDVGLPEGLRHRAELIAPDEETTLV
jgi:hypothetical protein